MVRSILSGILEFSNCTVNINANTNMVNVKLKIPAILQVMYGVGVSLTLEKPNMYVDIVDSGSGPSNQVEAVKVKI